MSTKADRDLEKSYPIDEFIAKLRRLADCLENGDQFEIQIAGERIYVPTTTSSTNAKTAARRSSFRSPGITSEARPPVLIVKPTA